MTGHTANRLHITEMKPYNLKINEVIEMKVDQRRRRKKIFNKIIKDLFKQENITDKDAIKVKKCRYKKHMINKHNTIGILLDMLVNSHMRYNRSDKEIEIQKKVWYNERYYSWSTDFNDLQKVAQGLRQQIGDLKQNIKELKKNLEKSS